AIPALHGASLLHVHRITSIPMETLESLLKSFRRVLKVQGKADRTSVVYGQSIEFFARWLTERGESPDLSNLTRENVLMWLESLRDRGLASGTISTRWKGM